MSAFKNSNKRQKTADLIAELSCPISKTLPIEPVMARDGRVHEREEIENYFETQDGEVVKSPVVTGAMIRKDLLPATQTFNAIKHLVDNSIITGRQAQKWKGKEMKQEVLKKAENGDLGAASYGSSR